MLRKRLNLFFNLLFHSFPMCFGGKYECGSFAGTGGANSGINGVPLLDHTGRASQEKRILFCSVRWRSRPYMSYSEMTLFTFYSYREARRLSAVIHEMAR